MKPSVIDRVSDYLGIPFSSEQRGKLSIFREWLGTEALRAGGIGPGETDKLETRHIADSLLFAGLTGAPDEAWDLGSGAGLPGIPLAIALPETKWVLIDRSGRRCDLMRRAVRILRLLNVRVIESDIDSLTGRANALVSRASYPPERLSRFAASHLEPGGVAVAGGSWLSAPEFDGWETKRIPEQVLDRPVWLLMMRSP